MGRERARSFFAGRRGGVSGWVSGSRREGTVELMLAESKRSESESESLEEESDSTLSASSSSRSMFQTGEERRGASSSVFHPRTSEGRAGVEIVLRWG